VIDVAQEAVSSPPLHLLPFRAISLLKTRLSRMRYSDDRLEALRCKGVCTTTTMLPHDLNRLIPALVFSSLSLLPAYLLPSRLSSYLPCPPPSSFWCVVTYEISFPDPNELLRLGSKYMVHQYFGAARTGSCFRLLSS
jgi:hypothetical protein